MNSHLQIQSNGVKPRKISRRAPRELNEDATMPNSKTAGSRTPWGIVFAVLFAVFGLSSCGGGGGGDEATATPTDPAITTFFATLTPDTDPIAQIATSAPVTLISLNTRVTLYWSSTDSTACTLTDPSGSFAVGATGANGTPPLTTTTTYTLECTGASGTTPHSMSTAVTITPPPPPTVTVSAASPSIANGATTLVTWTSTNSTSCASSSGTGGTGATGAFATPSLTATTTYLVSCTGSGGTTQQSTTVTVAAAAAPALPPTITFSAAPSSIAYNATSTLSWTSTNSDSSTNGISCTSSGGGGTGASGSFTTPALTATPAPYTVSCTGPGGAASQSATVTVSAQATAPVASLTVLTPAIANGAATQIAWSSTDSNSCAFSSSLGVAGFPSGFSTGAASPSGSFTTPPLTTAGTHSYTVTCTGPGGTATSPTRTVTVAAASAPTVTLSAAPSSILSGQTTIVTWSSTSSTSCTSSGGGGTGASGSFTTPALTGNTTYTVTCTGPGGTTPQSTTVSVGAAVPVVTLTASPSSIASGATSVLSWTSTNSTSCVLSGAGSVGTNSSYTTPPLTATTSYTLTCTGPGGVTPQSTIVTVMAGICPTTGNTAAIALPAVIPSRLSGVAPLAVFFEAPVTTATATAQPFHDLEYTWDFADPLGSPVNGANWNAGSRTGASSRNAATGPVAAHVFERPGTYNVILTVTDGTNTVTNNCTNILVEDPDVRFAGSSTICIGATSTPIQGQGGCPANALTPPPQPNFATAVNTYATTGKRVLLKRGDTFATNNPSATATLAAITRPGPGIIGAFGAGAAPVVQVPAIATVYDFPILNLSSRSTPGTSDWRVMDLELSGANVPDNGINCVPPSAGGPATPVPPCNKVMGIGTAGGIHEITFLRLNIHDTHNGIQFADGVLDFQNTQANPLYRGHTMFGEVAIVDTSVLRTIGGNGGVTVSFSANRFSMLGSVLDDSMWSEHIIRVFYLNKGVLSNNTLSRQAPTKGIIKLHGPTWCAPGSPTASSGKCTTTSTGYATGTTPHGLGGAAGGFTEQIVISDNKMVAENNTTVTVIAGPQSFNADERLRNIIFERNWFVPGDTTQRALQIDAVDVTVRNNICAINNAGCFQVSMRNEATATAPVSPEPPPDNVHVYNNTFYSATTGYFIGTEVRAPSTNTIVRNNLGWARLSNPAPTFTAMVINTGTGTVQDNNLLNNTAPNLWFVSATPAAPADFRLLPLPNTARDTGLATVPVFSDFFLTSRPQNGAPDLGAVEGP